MSKKLSRDKEVQVVIERLIGYADVAPLAMTSGNEKKFSKIIHKGNVELWVGIGWITLGKATKKDYQTLPVLP
jgi:hypothetical protein